MIGPCQRRLSDAKGPTNHSSGSRRKTPLPLNGSVMRSISYVVVLVAAVLSGCVVSPHRRCNIDASYWTYVPHRQLDSIDIEARRTVTDSAASELLHGETEQLWFRHSESQLFVCRMSRRANDMCFSNRDFVTYENGKWSRAATTELGSVMICTE